jgi:hypothetical protein
MHEYGRPQKKKNLFFPLGGGGGGGGILMGNRGVASLPRTPLRKNLWFSNVIGG